jgi:hypothetical protein
MSFELLLVSLLLNQLMFPMSTTGSSFRVFRRMKVAISMRKQGFGKSKVEPTACNGIFTIICLPVPRISLGAFTVASLDVQIRPKGRHNGKSHDKLPVVRKTDFMFPPSPSGRLHPSGLFGASGRALPMALPVAECRVLLNLGQSLASSIERLIRFLTRIYHGNSKFLFVM